MKVSKWVDFGQEVDVDLDFSDVQISISEAWSRITPDRFEEVPTRNEVISAMSRSLTFFKALKDEQIAELTAIQRQTIAAILNETAERFEVGGLFKQPAGAGLSETGRER